jgi:hypothetical protein
MVESPARYTGALAGVGCEKSDHDTMRAVLRPQPATIEGDGEEPAELWERVNEVAARSYLIIQKPRGPLLLTSELRGKHGVCHPS